MPTTQNEPATAPDFAAIARERRALYRSATATHKPVTSAELGTFASRAQRLATFDPEGLRKLGRLLDALLAASGDRRAVEREHARRIADATRELAQLKGGR